MKDSKYSQINMMNDKYNERVFVQLKLYYLITKHFCNLTLRFKTIICD